MNSENNVRNFYETEAQYEQATLEIKQIVEQIVKVDLEMLVKKIETIDETNKYEEFKDLFKAITGRKTNQYYYCKNMEDIKYSELELNKVYKKEEVNADIQSKMKEEKVLELPARAQLASYFINLVNSLKEDFSSNLDKGDGFISTINPEIIIESDINYLDILLKYLQLIIDETGRLKILTIEQDIYKKIEEIEQYNKKGAIGKFFYRAFNKEKK